MVSVSQHASVHRAAFFLDALQLTLFPAIPGLYVASFLDGRLISHMLRGVTKNPQINSF